MDENSQECCPICRTSVEGKPMVLLNRYIADSGQAFTAVEGRDAEGAYLWDIADDHDDSRVTGVALHFPQCLVMYLEGQMVMADIDAGNTN